jgi:dTDP-4-amino-4,6-dideoxygalactose transaminase
MNVPFVDLPRQIAPYDEELKTVFDEVVFDRADFIMRQDLLDFEKRYADYIGVKHAIGVANGSDALNLAVKVLGIGPGHEVITVSHTFVATIAAIKHAGASPVLIDIADDYNMDVENLEQAITPRTKAIIPVHLNGRVCNMKRIMEIAEKYHLAVIEDSAQAIGATFQNKKAGGFGDLSTNSFYPFKIVGCFGDGGMITTNDSDLNYKLRCLRDNGQDREKGDILFWGWNSRLDNLQAAILTVMLRHLPEIIARRREIAVLYRDGLASNRQVQLPPGPDSAEGDYFDVFQNYVVRTNRRDDLVDFLYKNNIGTLVSWPKPTHHHRALGLERFQLPNTESVSREVVSLPMHPALTDDEVGYVIDKIREFLIK